MRQGYLGVALCAFGGIALAQSPAVHGRNGVTLGAPPSVDVRPVTDTVGGKQLTDNYRWLEQQQAPETRAYIKTQTAYTDSYFAQVQPLRQRIVTRLTELQRVDTTNPPSEAGGRFFYSKREAAANQASIYMRVGLDGN